MKMTFCSINSWALILACVVVCLQARQGSAQSTTFTKLPFIIKIDTRGTHQSITGDPNQAELNNIYWSGTGALGIDWERDGTIDTLSENPQGWGFLSLGHVYSTPGVYEVMLYGDGEVEFEIKDASKQLVSVEDWGEVTWNNCSWMFLGANHLRSVDEFYAPVLSTPNLDCSNMFDGCSSLQVSSLNHWDMSNVVNMNSMFANSSFNGAIGDWDVSNVTQMYQVFQDNTSFNQDIGNWDVSSVEFANFMFQGATAFDQNLGSWDISNISNMFNMLSSSGMSTENYDATLTSWANLSSPPQGISLGASDLTYCASEASRQVLIDQYNWTISGDSKFCGNPPVAVCKDLDADIFDVYPFCLPIPPPFALSFFDFANNPNPTIFGLTFSLLEEDSFFEVGNHEVNLVVTDENGLSDTCQANLNVTANEIPSPYSAQDIGSQGSGSTYSFDGCGTEWYTITTGAQTTNGAAFDNLATITGSVCHSGNGFVFTNIEYASGGYAGVVVRAGDTPSAPVVGFFKGNGLVHQTIVRGTEGAPVSVKNHIASNSTIVGSVAIIKEGNYLRTFTRGYGDTWISLGNPIYFPYSCYNVGIAAYTFPHTSNVEAVFRNIRVSRSLPGNYLSEGPAPTLAIAQQDSAIKAKLVPNPATHQVQLQLPEPLSAPALVSVVNQLGQPLVEKQVADGAATVDLLLEGLPAGMYHVHVNTGSQLVSLPLVKQ
ncbi:BspA family leucine-rich repeat surface protein [Phaeodactylibacter xiamenensis]|uniref:BspA family leucine-rich repeat surface protein n=1 Tax=Phaeodactylibacter xiamenensis TaxID=1524460 RepID=UPI003CCC0E59